jgi:hypothetical protein
MRRSNARCMPSAPRLPFAAQPGQDPQRAGGMQSAGGGAPAAQTVRRGANVATRRLRLEPTERKGVLVLHDFIIANRERIIDRARLRVRGRVPAASVEARSEHGIPLFLTQLVQALQRDAAAKQLHLVGSHEPDQDIDYSASRHGQELLRNGFTVAQVVHGYGDV